jgi:hypothetical protein
MAKKIIIDFSAQPITTGFGFGYTIQVDSFLIYYSNGLNGVRIDFIPNGATPDEDYQLAIGTSLDETLQILLSYLRENYINDLVSYSLVNNTIEVLIQADAVVTIEEDLNANITITTEDVEPFGSNLKYYLYFDDYTLNIYKNNFQGTASEVYGTFTLKKSNVDTILTPIRGTALELSLEANQTLTFDEFLLEDEFTYKTELLKGTQIIFEGYIKPDGCQQSFVNDVWLVNIESNDVLGALKDLSFVQANGLPFSGKMSVYDVIKGCLDRTRLSLDINTSIYVTYVDYAGTNILKDIYVNADRFIKNQNDIVIMDCNEVLTSMLNLFSAVITQQDGQWWIYRPNDLELNGYTEFINQTTDAVFTKNLNAVLGSQINNFYPHHCDGNQQIEVKGAISAYRLNYQYGFTNGFVDNPDLNHDENVVFEDWTTNPDLPIYNANPVFPFTPILAFEIINEPVIGSGVEMRVSKNVPGTVDVLTSTPISALAQQVLTFRAKMSSQNVTHFFKFQIKTSDGYYLNSNNVWVLDNTAFVQVRCGTFKTAEIFLTYELLMPPLPNDCDVTIIICVPFIFPPSSFPNTIGISKITYIEILDNEIQKSGIVGEFHTVTRFNPPSSIVKENQKVFNGDGGQILIGSIYKENEETLTDFWTRKNKFEQLPLLGISAMDDLRIQSNPIKVFSGNIFGQIPYMSVITIDNISGLFMPIEYDYDYKTNKSQVKLLEFYNTDIADIQYTISPDYGNNTIKPTIKG